MRNLTKFFLGMFILIFMLTAQTLATAGEELSPVSVSVIFSDVSKGEPNLLFINYLANRGLVKGYSDGTFHPGANLTRAEAVTLLIRASGLKNKTAQSPYKDVKSTFWAAGNIIAAQEAGLIKGYPDGTFKPDAKLTRAEGIALLLRISKQPDPEITLPLLQDLSSQHWAAGPAAIGLAADMVSLAKDKKHFLPNVPMTRREMARALAVLLTKDPELAQTSLTNEIKVLQGTAKIYRAGTSLEVTGGLEVLPGDTVKTGSNSEVELNFSDGTGLRIKENTELIIKETKGRAYIKADGTKGTAVEWLALELKQGRIFGALATPAEITPTEIVASLKDQMVTILKSITAVENKPDQVLMAANKTTLPWWKSNKTKRVRVKVDMPWGVAAIRGTFWENVVNPNGRSKTTLLTGEAELTSGGQTVTLIAGQKTEVTSSSAAPLPPVPMTSQDKAEWVAAKEWAQERAQAIQVNQEKALPPPPPAGAPITPVEEVQAPIITLPTLIVQAIKDLTPSSSGGGGGGSSSVAVTGVSLDRQSLWLALSGGAPVTLQATLDPINATNKDVSWTSSDTAVISVNDNGLLTPQGQGTATVRVTSNEGGYYDECIVTVTSLTFQAAVPLAVGTGPLLAGIGNFNNEVSYDTYQDLVVVKTNETRLGFGDGSGTAFPTGLNLTTGSSPQGLVIGDFGDLYHKDIAIARTTTEDVYVMLGDGYGNFSGTSYSLGTTPISILAGSLDGQTSYTDLVVTRNVSDVIHDIYLLFGQGNGTFLSGGTYEVGNYPVGIAVANFDGMSMSEPKDLAVARTITNDVYILFNDGNGGFTSSTTIPLGAAPNSIVSGDFNHDYYADLAITRSGFNDVYILMGKGDGKFQPGISILTGSTPGYLAVANLDNDMGDEIVVTDVNSNTISVINCNDNYELSQVSFVGPVKFQVGDNPVYISIGDLGGNYSKDLVVVNSGSENLSILINNFSY